MNPPEQWLSFADRQVKRFSLVDVKLIQLCGAFLGIALVKLFPSLLGLSIWCFLAMALIVVAKPSCVFFFSRGGQPEGTGDGHRPRAYDPSPGPEGVPKVSFSSSDGQRIVRSTTPLIVLLALVCFLGGQMWTVWVQPELTTHVALAQMERSDEAAQWMRLASQAQQWPIGPMAFAFLAGVLLVLWPYRERPGTSPPGETLPSAEEENER